MKKLLTGAALLLVMSTTYASQSGNHKDEHNIVSTTLPTALQSDIKKDYAGYWITALTQEGEGRHAKYQLTLENADQTVHLRSGNAESWEVVSTNVKAD